MIKVISKMPVVPPSLIVSGVSVPVMRDYIGGGGLGLVFKGELQGAVVALKVLYKSDDNVVSHLTSQYYKAVVDVHANRPFVVKH